LLERFVQGVPSLVCLGVAIELAILAVAFGGPWLLLLWPAFAFSIVGVAYLTGNASFLGKSNGSFRIGALILLGPYLSLCAALWHLVRLSVREAPWHRITPTLFVGRRLLRREFPHEIASVVDLTSELPAVVPQSPCVSYLGLPMLDGVAPTPAALLAAVEDIAETPQPIYVHCAQGHGRTGLVASALLIANGVARDPDDAIASLKAIRPGIRLNRHQLRVLRGFHDVLARRTEAAQQAVEAVGRTSS
jgi:protein-tyrosine phosphatase